MEGVSGVGVLLESLLTGHLLEEYLALVVVDGDVVASQVEKGRYLQEMSIIFERIEQSAEEGELRPAESVNVPRAEHHLSHDGHLPRDCADADLGVEDEVFQVLDHVHGEVLDERGELLVHAEGGST